MSQGTEAVLNKVRTSGQNGGDVEEWLDFIFTSKYSIFVFSVSFLQLNPQKRILLQRKCVIKGLGVGENGKSNAHQP